MKESLFKKILWADILCWPLLFAAFYFQPQYVSDLYDYSESLPSFLNSGLELSLAIAGLVLYFFSYILLFRFNKLGRILYPLAFVFGIILDTQTSVVISSGIVVGLDHIQSMFGGVIIFSLFLSPIKDKFM
tara:strand:+ start:339 stop:731 length:393 start_codon:yes stop_codon:yes gene_type:complete